MSDTITIGSATQEPKPFCAAHKLGSGQRQALAVEALAGVQPITQLLVRA